MTKEGDAAKQQRAQERADRMARGYATYWLSRDSDSTGTLSDVVEVWLVRPDRERLPGGGVMWLGPDNTGVEHRYAQWTPEVCLAECHVYPQTDRELIRCGPETDVRKPAVTAR